MKLNRIIVSLLLVLSSSFIEVVGNSPKSSLRQQAEEKCGCKYSPQEIFLHRVRERFNKENNTKLRIAKVPGCVSKGAQDNFEKFAQDVPFVTDKGKCLTPEFDPKTNELFIRLSSVEIFTLKMLFIKECVDVEGIENGKFDAPGALTKSFQEWLEKRNQK